VRSDELLLHLKVALDKGLDDLVDAGVGDEPARFGARGAPAPVRLAGDDRVDQHSGLNSVQAPSFM